MIKKIFFMAIALFGSAHMLAQSTILNVKLQNTAVGDKVGVILIDGYNYEKPLEEVTLVDGEGMLKFDIPSPRGFYFTINGKLTGELFVLGKGEHALLTGTKQVIGNYYRVGDMKLTGSATQDAYQARKLDRSALDRLHEAYTGTPFAKKLNAALAAGDKDKAAALQASPEGKEFAAAEKHFFHVVDSTFKTVHKNNADNWMGAFMILTDYSYLTPEQQSEYDLLSDEVKNSFYGKIVKGFVTPAFVKGAQMPDFTFTDHQSGKKTSLYEICKKSRYVLIDFWASWCGPCRKEIPNFKAQYALYHKKGFDIVSISADSKEADWIKALNEEKLPWPNDIDGKQGICAKYKVSAYPTVYLLDSEAKVIAKDMEARGENLRQLLAELFTSHNS